jgi:hypothetical protein
VQSHLLTDDGDALKAGKCKSSAVFLFSLFACSPIRIFQREMSDALDTFGPMIMHVHCNGHSEAPESAITGGSGERKKFIHTFDCLHLTPLVVSASLEYSIFPFVSVSHICYP